MFSEFTVTHHVTHFQSLQTDHLVFVDQGAGEFVEVVVALRCDMLMTPRYTDTGFGTVLGAFLFTGEGLLQTFEVLLGSLVVPGVVDFGAIGQCSEMGESEIDASDICAGGFSGTVFAGESDVIFPRGCHAQGTG